MLDLRFVRGIVLVALAACAYVGAAYAQLERG